MGSKVKLEHWEWRDSGSRGREKGRERGRNTQSEASIYHEVGRVVFEV